MENRIIHKIVLIFFAFSQLALAQLTIKNQNTLLNRAEMYVNRGMYSQALPILKMLYQKDPNNIRIVSNLGKCYIRLKQPDAALSLISSYNSLENAPLQIQMIALETYLLKSEKEKAERLLKNILQKLSALKNSSALQFNSLSNLFLNYRMPDKSIEILKIGYQVNPAATYLLNSLAYIQASQMRYLEATRTFIKILTLQKNMFSLVSGQILSMRMSSEQLDQVEKEIKKAIKRFPKNKELRRLLVEFYLKKEKLNQAFSILKTLPEELQKSYVLSIAGEFNRQNKFDKALELLYKYFPGTQNKQRASFYHSILNTLLKKAENTGEINKNFLDSTLKSISEDKYISFNEAINLQLWYLEKFVPITGDIDQGIKIAKGILAKPISSTTRAKVLLLLGSFYRLKNDLIKSSKYYLQIDSTLSEKILLMARFQHYKNLFFAGKWERLDSLFFSTLLRIPPQDTLANNILYYSYLLKMQLNDTLKSVLGKAMLFREQKRFEMSQKMFYSIYIKTDSSSFEHVWSGLQFARDALALNRGEKALPVLTSLINISRFPELQEEALFLLGNLYYDSFQKYEAARNIYLKALQLFPEGKYSKLIRSKLEKMKVQS